VLVFQRIYWFVLLAWFNGQRSILLQFVHGFGIRRLLRRAAITAKLAEPYELKWQQKSILLLAAFIGGAYAAKIGAIIEEAPRTGFSWLAFMSDGNGRATNTQNGSSSPRLARMNLGYSRKRVWQNE